MIQVKWYFSTETKDANYSHLLESALAEIAEYTGTGGTLIPCRGYYRAQDRTIFESAHILELVFQENEYSALVGATVATLLKSAFHQQVVLYTVSPITVKQVGSYD